MKNQLTQIRKGILFLSLLLWTVNGFSQIFKDPFIEHNLEYCKEQALRTVSTITSVDKIPDWINTNGTRWNYTRRESWTAGFWPGILWYLYDNTRNDTLKTYAELVSDNIIPITKEKIKSHDIGFITMCSLGNGYRIMKNEAYKDALLCAADSLATLFNPRVGTILSWPGMMERQNWPHNTIIDNMMNLELLFWASKNGGSHRLYEIACKHADTTMKYQFRKDYSCYHVTLFDSKTGKFIKGITHQGLNDDSMWARGQAWAIYGFTMAYRETRDRRYLDFVQKVAKTYLNRLPKDMIPYWDFDAVKISDKEPRDASAAAITASALLELSTYVPNKNLSKYYIAKAKDILKTLSSSKYQARNKNSSFLLHSVGHKPNNSQVDASIIYADYYYLEALLRLKNIEKGNSVV